MKDILVDRYNKISTMIDKEKNKYDDDILSRLIASLLNNEEKDQNTIDQNHSFFQLAYTCLKTLICCQLISVGQRNFLDKLQENIKQVIESVKEAEYAWEISDEILLDSYDVLTLLCSKFKVSAK